MHIRNALLVAVWSARGLAAPGSAGRRDATDASGGIPSSYVLHERHEREQVDGWVRREVLEAGSTLPVRIGLRQSNVDVGHGILMDISNPRSPNYGKHLSRDQVIDLFAPEDDSIRQVKRWLTASGIDEARLSQSENKQWIHFDAPVQEVERLLLTKYHIFEHAETGALNIACSEYHIPHNISHHIDYITPGVKLVAGGYDEVTKRILERRNQKRKDSSKLGAVKKGTSQGTLAPRQLLAGPTEESLFRVRGPCNEAVTPQCIRAQYQIPNGTRAARGNELGIFQSLGQHYSQYDLDKYWKYVAPWIPQGTHPELRSINGAYGPTDDVSRAGFEADLDFQVAIPLVWPQRTVLFQTDDEWYQQDQQRPDTRYPGFFNTFFDAIDASYCTLSAFNLTGNCAEAACRDPEYPNPNAGPGEGGYAGPLMCGAHRPTRVVAVSYSGPEQAWPAAYVRRQCLEVLKLALQGVTVVASSGDFGVGGGRWDPRAGCLGRDRAVFAPRVLSNCPYVLSVGATALVEAGGGGDRGRHDNAAAFVETASVRFASGGGFSNVFPRPPWQDRHVEGYFSRVNMSHLGYVNPAGERYSDGRAEPGKLFNRAGRGYPDVAAVGENFRVVYRGYPNRMHGTSVAVPIWASILTLINEERLAANKSPVGFVHPVLYEHPEVFIDITNGSNPGCGGAGFPAKEGWDPVTGLGTPIYPMLRDLFMSLP